MSQKIPANNFEWIKDTSQFNEDLKKSYNEESDEGYFIEVDVQYVGKLHELHNDWLFLTEGMKIKNVGKLVANLYDQNEFVILIKKFKTSIK